MSENINKQNIIEEQGNDTIDKIISTYQVSFETIFKKQFELYSTVYVPRICNEHEFNTQYEFFTFMDKQNVLSIMNELWELIDQNRSKSSIDEFFEIVFEVSDLYHFVYQGLILQLQKMYLFDKYDGLDKVLSENLSDQEFLQWVIDSKNELEIYKAEKEMVSNQFESKLRKNIQPNPDKIIFDMYLILSDILNYVDWKHWKTYEATLNIENQDYISYRYYQLLKYMGHILGIFNISPTEIIDFYNMKEKVNRERQKNNY